MFGQPLFLRWGGQFKMGGQVLKTHMNWGKDWIQTNKLECPIDKSTKVTISDQLNVGNVFTNPSEMAYKLGFAVEFSM